MPYNQDIVIDQTNLIIDNLRFEMNLEDITTTDLLDFQWHLKNELDELNSRKKRFRVPKPENISDVLLLVSDYRSANNESDWNVTNDYEQLGLDI
jgi:hypothetical protein